MDKKMSFEKYMKIRVMTFGAAFLIFTILYVVCISFSFDSDKLISLFIAIIFIVYLVILVKEKRYWQYKYMNQLKGVRKAVKIFSGIGIVAILVSMALKLNGVVGIIVADCYLLLLFAEECYYFKFAKKYNMEDFETKEEFVEKHPHLK